MMMQLLSRSLMFSPLMLTTSPLVAQEQLLKALSPRWIPARLMVPRVHVLVTRRIVAPMPLGTLGHPLGLLNSPP